MKRQFQWMGALALAAAAALAAAGQETGGGAAAKPRGLTRTDFDAYQPQAQNFIGAPGVKVQIELTRGGRKRLVSPGATFYSGDIVRFVVTSNFEARMAIANTDVKRTELLFPLPGDRDILTPGVPVHTPEFRFDKTAGVEKVAIVLGPVTEKAFTESIESPAGGGVLIQAGRRANSKGLTRVDSEQDTVVLAPKKESYAEPVAVTFELKHRPPLPPKK